MQDTEAVIALVVGVVVIFFVPALVWSAVIAGMNQVISKKIQESFKALKRKIQTVTNTR